MLFNSFEYIFFLAGITFAYFISPYRWRIWLLLAGSYYFYMQWKWEFIFLILFQTLLNYLCGYKIALAAGPQAKKGWLTLSLTATLGMLFFFKYYNFGNETARAFFMAAGLPYIVPHLNVLLPVGISFYTFQTLSYTIDVYRNKCRVEPHFGRFALFVSFFPQLVAGPIERAGHLLSQFRRHNRFDLIRFTQGAKLIAWGLFKKAVIADRLAIYVDRVYASPEHFSGSTLALATYFFTFQIYCDFSGYSDIAIGSARILGYDLMQNFRLPYLASSITDFWRRWHISLSTWFRDYLYIPLGGNKVDLKRWVFNIYAVFLISGLWHGANWTFVVWGGVHGSFYLIESLFQKARIHMPNIGLPGLGAVAKPIQIVITFHIVAFAWIFFRANSLADAWLIATRIPADLTGRLYLGPSQLTTLLSLCLIGLLMLVQLLQYRGISSLYFSAPNLPRNLRWAGYLAMTTGIALLGMSANEFIYFQF